jgi:protein N-terminal methyltransferase
LTDSDLVDFFKRCKQALKPSGVCVLKENLTIGQYDFDKEDSSFTRPRQAYLDIIHKAGMHLIRDERQRKFPTVSIQ